MKNEQGSINSGFKEHFILKGDGSGGMLVKKSEYQFLQRSREEAVMPYGIAQMDNGEIILVAGAQYGKDYYCVTAFSPDGGETWSDFEKTGVYGRPLTFGYLGKGRVVFGNELLANPLNLKQQLHFSEDYGRKWVSRDYPLESLDGRKVFTTEGHMFAEDIPEGEGIRIAHLNVYLDAEAWDKNPCSVYLRWSEDFGESWINEQSPEEWQRQVEYNGKQYAKGTNEGSIIRAANGWLVAALRTDLPPRFHDEDHDDSLEGLGISVSKDDGKTWAPVNVLYDAGRHHPNLIVMPNGTIVLTCIVRDDCENGGKLASYRRGCEAIISLDNGLTWDVDEKYILDSCEYYENSKWYNGMTGHLGSALLNDGSIITAYGNYLTKGISIIKWQLN